VSHVKVAQLSQLPAGETREVEFEGRILALCNDGGTVTALDGVCPHHGGPLGHGMLNEGRVACPWHLWEFDCRTGAYDRDPSLRVATYSVEVRGDDILVDLERPGA
jgi:nitrite reductase (NADH) small subunit